MRLDIAAAPRGGIRVRAMGEPIEKTERQDPAESVHQARSVASAQFQQRFDIFAFPVPVEISGREADVAAGEHATHASPRLESNCRAGSREPTDPFDAIAARQYYDDPAHFDQRKDF